MNDLLSDPITLKDVVGYCIAGVVIYALLKLNKVDDDAD